jgi:3-deoxy-manno-octulosonate cytidylyltransferase (CMP-KDO synthetase)
VLLFVVHPASTGSLVDSKLPLDIVAVIPARFASTRFPGKPLADIEGRTMIEHVYRRAEASPVVSRVIVATDDLRIATTVNDFGGTVRLTRPDHLTGTDRLAEVVSSLDCDIVVNVQGDEPLLDPRAIGEVVAPFSDPSVTITTLYRRIQTSAELTNPDVVKVVLDRAGFALYFSRAPIPYARDPRGGWPPLYRHIGVYAYNRSAQLVLA